MFVVALVLSEPSVVKFLVGVVWYGVGADRACGGDGLPERVVAERCALFHAGGVRDGGDVAVDVRVGPHLSRPAFGEYHTTGQTVHPLKDRVGGVEDEVGGVTTTAVSVTDSGRALCAGHDPIGGVTEVGDCRGSFRDGDVTIRAIPGECLPGNSQGVPTNVIGRGCLTGHARQLVDGVVGVRRRCCRCANRFVDLGTVAVRTSTGGHEL